MTPRRAALRQEAARFLRFALVGGTGFLVDACVLAGLIHFAGLDPFTARLASILAAAITTWRLNRVLTFGASVRGSQLAEGARYFLVAGLAALLNYGIYAIVLILVPATPPLAAMVLATGIAMLVSYVGYSRFAFAATSDGAPSSHKR